MNCAHTGYRLTNQPNSALSATGAQARVSVWYQWWWVLISPGTITRPEASKRAAPAVAGLGAAFVFLSPVLGWLGTAVTGSDTSANALFSTLQQTAATNIGADPALLVAANTSGGVVGKMISPQSLAIAATAVGMEGRESEILRRVVVWSLVLLLAVCTLVYLQSNVLAWMLPAAG